MNPFICSYLALVIQLSLNARNFEANEFLFRSVEDEKVKVASSNYCSQLKEMIMRHWDTVSSFILLAHANSHGCLKVKANYATSGTTCPPPIPSVARRG